MDATLILVDSDAKLDRALKSLESMMGSDAPATNARATAQARLIAAYEESKWTRPCRARPTSSAALMDQHGLTRADMIPILGIASRVGEVLSGKKGLSMTMVQRLRARIGVPADVLPPPPGKAKRKAA